MPILRTMLMALIAAAAGVPSYAATVPSGPIAQQSPAPPEPVTPAPTPRPRDCHQEPPVTS